MKNKIWIVLIVAISFATISFLLYAVAYGSDNLPVDNCSEIYRLAPSDTMQRIYMNDSDFQNLTKGNYKNEGGGIFNETGESRGYIRINYFYEVTIEMQSGTVLQSIETEGSLEDLYREADSPNGSIKSIHSQITGGEFYMITVDIPNGTVKSIEKVNELPEWTGTIEEVDESNKEVIDESSNKERVISKLLERTGYSREELFGPVNPFGNKTNESEESLS